MPHLLNLLLDLVKSYDGVKMFALIFPSCTFHNPPYLRP